MDNLIHLAVPAHSQNHNRPWSINLHYSHGAHAWHAWTHDAFVIHPFAPLLSSLLHLLFFFVMRTSMGQEEAFLPAPAAVAFSWEQDEPLVPKPAMHAGGGMPPSPRKTLATVVLSWEEEPAMAKPVSAPTVKPRGVPESARKAQPPARRLSVPPPPGRPSTRGASRAVRPEDDPFLAAYLTCTKSTGGRGGDGGKRKPAKGRRRFAWARLRLGGLSCKRDDGVVAQNMVGLAKLPELDPRDA